MKFIVLSSEDEVKLASKMSLDCTICEDSLLCYLLKFSVLSIEDEVYCVI